MVCLSGSIDSVYQPLCFGFVIRAFVGLHLLAIFLHLSGGTLVVAMRLLIYTLEPIELLPPHFDRLLNLTLGGGATVLNQEVAQQISLSVLVGKELRVGIDIYGLTIGRGNLDIVSNSHLKTTVEVETEVAELVLQLPCHLTRIAPIDKTIVDELQRLVELILGGLLLHLFP